MFIRKCALLVATVCVSASAFATIDSIGEVAIPYMPVHAENDYDTIAKSEDMTKEYQGTQMFCMATSMFWDPISSTSMTSFDRMMQPFEIPVVPAHHNFKKAQINALVDEKIKVTTNWKDFDKYVEDGVKNDWSKTVHEPKFVIDVTAYDQSTAAGRLEALTMAKLAIASLHYNLAKNGWLRFRLNIEVKGLPSDQTEFTSKGWSKVKTEYRESYDSVGKQNGWPISGPSSVAQTFYKELISTEFCNRVADEVKNFN